MTVYASAAEVTRRRRQVWLLVGGLAIVGTAAAAGLARAAGAPVHPPAASASRPLRPGSAPATSRRAPAHMELPELDRVARALDAAAVQIAQLVGRQREFAANVSHQLRTPLTAMRPAPRRARHARGPGRGPRGDRGDAARRRPPRTTVTDLLALARAGDIGRPRDIDLAELARAPRRRTGGRSTRAAGRRLRDRRRRARCRRASARAASPRRSTSCSRTRSRHGAGITRLDARRSTAAACSRSRTTARASRSRSEHAIFDRDVSTAGSTGLGLPLARALVEADGGRLILARARPARFAIVLPRRTQRRRAPDDSGPASVRGRVPVRERVRAPSCVAPAGDTVVGWTCLKSPATSGCRERSETRPSWRSS